MEEDKGDKKLNNSSHAAAPYSLSEPTSLSEARKKRTKWKVRYLNKEID